MRSMRPRHLLVPIGQATRDAEPLEVSADDLAPPDALGDQASPLWEGDVFLLRREAHRVVPGQLGDILLTLIARRTMSRRASAKAPNMQSRSGGAICI
jgi:hypothetical protein